MHYDPDKEDHGFQYSPFKSCVVPRPIGWISTTSATGIDNLAPYSQFQNLSFDPPMVMIAANQTFDGQRKDTVVNIEATGEFVWNMATYDLREAVNLSSAVLPPEIDEFEVAGVTKAPSLKVRPPRVAESPIQFECRHVQTVRLPGEGKTGTCDLVIGRVVQIHIDDRFITEDGRIDVVSIKPLARMGYYDYTYVDKAFSMLPPNATGTRLAGLTGTRAVD
ncbi:MAG: flavin reductase family protein [Gammaproteobacteria bacterium]|nr:flavin reductase family protein [Gammaproteobacteria bacterium]